MNQQEMTEKLSDLEHEQWMEWSKTLAKEFEEIKVLVKERKGMQAVQKINARLERWEKNWKLYSELDDATKEFDRMWARKAMVVVAQYLLSEHSKDIPLITVRELIIKLIDKPMQAEVIIKKDGERINNVEIAVLNEGLGALFG